MFWHIVKQVFRSFNKDRNTFLINLIGLSTSLFCGIVIYLWVFDELTYDKGYPNLDRIYQVMLTAETPNGVETDESIPFPAAETLKARFFEFEYSGVTIFLGDRYRISIDDNFFLKRGRLPLMIILKCFLLILAKKSTVY